jgi:hypothetical protein
MESGTTLLSNNYGVISPNNSSLSREDPKRNNSVTTGVSSVCNNLKGDDTTVANTSYQTMCVQHKVTPAITPHVPVIEALVDRSVTSGRLSSISGLADDESSSTSRLGRVMVPYENGNNQEYRTPHYSMTTNPIYNTLQRNIIVAPSSSNENNLEVERYRAEDDRRVLLQRLREMELQLTYERVRNDSVLQELRETNRNNTRGESKISVNACIIL